MKKLLILLIVAITQFNVALNAQNSDSMKRKQHIISVGLSLKDGNKNYGGSLKYEFPKNDKTSFGFKTLLYNNQTYDYRATNYYINERPSLYCIFEGVLTKYLTGNINKSKAGIYLEFGLGYHLDKSSANIQFNGFPSFKNNSQAQGLGSTLAIGSRLRIGKGDLYFEGLLGGILIGNYYNKFIFPAAYPGLSSGNPYPNNGPEDSGIAVAFVNGYPFINDGLIAINFGYRYKF
jgi:hypothetical protein